MTAVMCPDEQGPGLLPVSGEHAPSEILAQPYANTGALQGLEPRARGLRDPRSLAP
jgi:hypothetical protein